MEKLEIGKYYPLAPGERLPNGYDRKTARVKATGEMRRPKKGEWFLSGSPIEAYEAINSMMQPYYIGELVKGVPEKTNLGLATTREMLEELKARAEVTMPREDKPFAVATFNLLLNTLTDESLDYRTVG